MNIFDMPGLPLRDELETVLAKGRNARIIRIISTGQTSGWYDQGEAEFVALFEGSAEIEFENKFVKLKKGDTLLIKPRERHRVSYTSSNPPCVWLCVFFS